MFNTVSALLKYNNYVKGFNPFDTRFKLFNKLMTYMSLLILLLAGATLFPINHLFERSKKNIIIAEVSMAHDFFKDEINEKKDVLPKMNSMLPYSLENIVMFDEFGELSSIRELSKDLFIEVQTLYNLYNLEVSSEPIFTENTNYFFYVIKDDFNLKENIFIIPKANFLAEFNSFKETVYVIVAIVTLGLLLLSFFLLRKLLSPIEVLHKTTKKIVLGNYVTNDSNLGTNRIADILENMNVISDILKTKKAFLSNYNMLLQKKFFELEQKKKRVEYQNEQIESDLRYAKQIQSELLSNYYDHQSNDVFSWFPLLKPLGIVSGDFYNISSITINDEEHTFFSVADCTGHGVQAALLTVMANNALNATLEQRQTTDIGSILKGFNRQFVSSFSQDCKHSKIESGLDIAIVAINHKTKTMTYGGAYRPCVIKRDGEIIQLKANRISLGFLPCDLINVKIKERADFKTQTFDLEKDDEIFIFSDGITDQFSSENTKKFGSKRLLSLIKGTDCDDFFDVKTQVADELIKWQGNTIQTDDQLLVGIKIH